MPHEDLRVAMSNAGVSWDGPIIADGKLHYFKAAGDKSKKSWYVLHLDAPVTGVFGCFKRGIKIKWHPENRESFSQAERKVIQQRWQAAQRENAIKQAELHRQAAKTVADIMAVSPSAPADHPYLQRKEITVTESLRLRHGKLVVPLRDSANELCSLQFIDADGSKKFLSGGRVAGAFFGIGDKSTGPLIICEGFATGASIHQATGLPVVCAMNCGNLIAVAESLRAKFPNREIIVASDNDAFTVDLRKGPWNPGVEAATKAAKRIGARLVVPQFQNISTEPTDFNDLALLEGINTVKDQIENALAVTTDTLPGSRADEYLGTDGAAPARAIQAPKKYSPPPLTLLPPKLVKFVVAAAKALGVDVAYIFLPILSALAAAVGNSRVLRIKKGFVVPPIIWTTTVGRSGSKKSPSLTCAAAPFIDREREFCTANEMAEVLFEKDHREWDATPKESRGPEPKRPASGTCILDDLTLAVVAPVLRNNPRGALVVKDEMASFFSSFGQFSSGKGGASSDLSNWLQLHNGERLFMNRKTNNENHRIFNPRLSIAGCIPPTVLKEILTLDFFQRGLPARILFAAPPPRPNRWTDEEVSQAVEDGMKKVFTDLFALEADAVEDAQTPKVVFLSDEARAVFVKFFNETGEHALEADEKEEAAWAKLTGGAARLALIGHLANGLDLKPVSEATMKAAVELATWFGNEAERIYASFHESPEAVLCGKLEAFLARQDGPVTVRYVADNFRPLKNKVEEIEQHLNGFVSAKLGDWIPSIPSDKGGKPTRSFQLFREPPACPCPGNHEFPPQTESYPDTDTPGISELNDGNTPTEVMDALAAEETLQACEAESAEADMY